MVLSEIQTLDRRVPPSNFSPSSETCSASSVIVCTWPSNSMFDQRTTTYEAGHEVLRPPEPLPTWQIKDILGWKVKIQGTG